MRALNSASWADTKDLERLRGINTLPLGSRHVPLNHGDVLAKFWEGMKECGMTVATDRGMLSPDTYKYMYVAELANQGMRDKSMTFNIGFINYNNKQRSFRVLAGERVFVCSNEMFSGEVKESKRKHTKNAWEVLREKMSAGFDMFKKFTDARKTEIDRLKALAFPDVSLGAAVLELHRKSGLGNTDIDRIIKEWDAPTFDYGVDKNTAWNFQNACTFVIKENVSDPLRRVALHEDIRHAIEAAVKV